MRGLRNQKGFTLIELVMIIVILGILAATAVIKYIDLQTDAERAACKGIYGQMVSAYGITVASLKSAPSAAQINANLSGTAGDFTLPTNAIENPTDIIKFNEDGNDNTIQGNKITCSFSVDNYATITDVGTLYVP